MSFALRAFEALLLFFLYGLGLVIYRLYLHPLARFPGPKLAAATKWWEFYMDVLKDGGGTYAWRIDKMHEDYGPIVRINPDELHVKDPEWFEHLYVGYGNNQRRDKYPPAADMFGSGLGTFGTILHDVHRKRRNAISPFFSTRSIESLEPHFQHNMRRLCDVLEEHMATANKTQIRVDYLAFTSESLLNAAFGSSLGLLGDVKKAADWKDTMDAVAFGTPLVKQFPFIIPFARSLPIGLVNYISTTFARIISVHKDMIRQAELAIKHNQLVARIEKADTNSKAALIEASPIFQLILSSSLPESEKRRDRIAQEGATVFVAGAETTARVLTTATYHLLANENVLIRLQEELRKATPDPSMDFDLKKVERLPWLTAIIKEALRIGALITSRSPLISPNQPLQYGDWEIPSGTPVSMTLGSVLLDPAAFVEPYKFKPDRWLDDSPEAPRAHKFLVAFNKGTRMCIGMSFAWAEMYIVLATVFRRYRMELFDTVRSRDVDHARDFFLGSPKRESQGVRVKILGKLH